MKPIFSFRVGVPKNDRLFNDISSLLKQAAIWSEPQKRQLFVDIQDHHLSLILGRAGEIARSLNDRTLSCGFIGRDLLNEFCNGDIVEIFPLYLGKCQLVFAVPEGDVEKPISFWNEKIIATSFVRLSKRYFDKHNVKPNIKEVAGGVEGKVATGEADAIIDLTETGTTLSANGLKIKDKLLDTEIVFVAHRDFIHDERIHLIKNRLEGVRLARQSIMIEYMIPKEKLQDAITVAGGQKSPTVAAIYGDDRYFGVKIVEPLERENEIMDKLKSVGAFGIFSVLLHNTRV